MSAAVVRVQYLRGFNCAAPDGLLCGRAGAQLPGNTAHGLIYIRLIYYTRHGEITENILINIHIYI